MRYALLFFGIMSLQQGSFKQTQLKHSNVKTAYEEKESLIKQLFAGKKINYSGFHLFLRGFKKEMKLEAWVKERGKDQYTLLQTFDFCSSSGVLGPKRKEGDLQIPEGIYHLNHFNPQSKFYLSLGISYPNASDKILSDPKQPGSAIYIHGKCVTIGCIPITDDKIKELYLLGIEARNNGQQKIPIHIFPSSLDDKNLAALKQENITHEKFWTNLQPIYLDFENTKRLCQVTVNSKGEYKLKPRQPAPI